MKRKKNKKLEEQFRFVKHEFKEIPHIKITENTKFYYDNASYHHNYINPFKSEESSLKFTGKTPNAENSFDIWIDDTYNPPQLSGGWLKWVRWRENSLMAYVEGVHGPFVVMVPCPIPAQEYKDRLHYAFVKLCCEAQAKRGLTQGQIAGLE